MTYSVHTHLLMFSYVSLYLPPIKKELGLVIIKLMGQEDQAMRYTRAEGALRVQNGQNKFIFEIRV